MSQVKEQVRQVLDQLPDNCSLEDVQYRLYVLQKIQRGLKDLDEGRVVPHDDVKRRLAQRLTG